MWKGKLKAVTFSFDDGAVQDERVVDILNKYGLKGTFNLNSGRLGSVGSSIRLGRSLVRDMVLAKDVKEIYAGHEVACHTVAHPNLTQLSDDAIVYQIERDRQLLSDLCGYEIVGMAYPGGGVNHDDRVAEVVRTRTGVKYARGNGTTWSFDVPANLYDFEGTCHFVDPIKLMAAGEKFLSLNTDKYQLFYIWGHAYELDYTTGINWKSFEEFCKMISGRDDIYYGTNKEVLL